MAIQFKKFKIVHLLLAVLVIAIILAGLVEQQEVIGQSKTRSPDGNWSLNLKLTEYSTLLSSRRTLDAVIEHSTNEDWTVSTSVPFDDADARTIGNEDQNYPIVWSEDSSTVNYWINEDLEDCISVEANSERFKFKRKLYSVSVIHSSPKNSGQ